MADTFKIRYHSKWNDRAPGLTGYSIQYTVYSIQYTVRSDIVFSTECTVHSTGHKTRRREGTKARAKREETAKGNQRGKFGLGRVRFGSA